MIAVSNPRLRRDILTKLNGYQDQVNLLPNYGERVKAAKLQFKSRNRRQNSVFREVRHKLDQMCRGSKRCMYCEDAPADEVEHIKPKDLYPENVFSWNNYLYACGPCNGPKNNLFAVIVKSNIVEVTRKFGSPVVPPTRGRPAIINPRRENPLDFFMLDIMNTFEFVIVPPPGTLDFGRADHTLRVLGLNEREYLIESRRVAYGAYCSLLDQYCTQTRAGNLKVAERARRTIVDSHHPTVWAEMRRQRDSIGELKAMFNDAPEAIGWA